jgi:hypothetical protein
MIVCVVLCVAPSCARGIRTESTSGGTLLATSGETEFPTVSAGPLGQAWSARTSLPARAAADDGNLIGSGADHVQDEVVDDEEGPWPDHDDTQEHLQGPEVSTEFLAGRKEAAPHKQPLQPCLHRHVLGREQGEQAHGRQRRTRRETRAAAERRMQTVHGAGRLRRSQRTGTARAGSDGAENRHAASIGINRGVAGSRSCAVLLRKSRNAPPKKQQAHPTPRPRPRPRLPYR